MRSDTAEWSLEDQAAGYSLPARFFYDEEIFKKERTSIFFKILAPGRARQRARGTWLLRDPRHLRAERARGRRAATACCGDSITCASTAAIA